MRGRKIGQITAGDENYDFLNNFDNAVFLPLENENISPGESAFEMDMMIMSGGFVLICMDIQAFLQGGLVEYLRRKHGYQILISCGHF